ncbi:hypothetical protein HDU67_004494 [Dinochytrium kinnereticum]|nr:hypothetical protein HDU67_004494 [Dinochytrium kinnereticum]
MLQGCRRQTAACETLQRMLRLLPRHGKCIHKRGISAAALNRKDEVDWSFQVPEGSSDTAQRRPRQPYPKRDRGDLNNGWKPKSRSPLNNAAKAKLGKVRGGYIDDPMFDPHVGVERDAGLKRDGEIRPPDFHGFEAALKEKDRVAAWLKFKDICFSDEKGRLNASHVLQVMTLLMKHQPPKLFLMETCVNFSKQMGLTLDMSHYNLLIGAACKLKDFPTARKHLTDAVDSGLKPDMKTYHQFLVLYAYERNVDGAIVFFNKMIEEGIQPDTATFNAVMTAGMNSRKRAIVIEYKEKMASFNISPDQGTYDILIRTHASLGDLDAAEAAYMEMLNKNIPASAKVLTSLITALADSGRTSRMEPILEEASKCGLEMDMYLYTAVIYAYFKAKDTRSAVLKFEEMVASGCKPDVTAFQNLISGFCEMGLPTKAEEAMTFMKSGQITVPQSIYRTVMMGYLEARMVSDAVRVFEQQRMDGLMPNTASYNYLLKGLAEDFDIELMSRYWEQWRQSIEMGEQSVVKKRGLSRDGDDRRPPVEMPQPDAYSFTIVLEAYLKCSRIEKATELLKEMMAKRLEPDVKSFIGLVEAHVRARNYFAAGEIITLMRSSATARKNTGLTIIRTHAGQFESLINTVLASSEALNGGVNGPAVIPRTLKELAESGLNLEKATEAKAKRQIGIELYRELVAAGVPLREETYCSVIRAHHAAGDLVSAIKVWTTFRKEFPDRLPQAVTVTALLTCVRDWGKSQTSKALLKIVKTESLPLDQEGYVAMACIMAKYGMSDELNRVLVDMVNVGMKPTPVIVREVEAYLKMGENAEALAAVMGFLEENWPEAFMLDDGGDKE